MWVCPINKVTLTGPGEREVARTLEATVKTTHARGWEINWPSGMAAVAVLLQTPRELGQVQITSLR